jgi:hypothetical protein
MSTNLLINSTYGQGSEYISSDSQSKKNVMVVSIKTQEAIFRIGDKVDFIISVTDSDLKPIDDAKIYGKMIFPDEIHKHIFEGRTRDNGEFILPLTIDNRISLGELEMNLKVTADGYEPKSYSSTGSVISPPDSNLNENPDTGTEYMIRSSPNVKDAYSFAVAGDYGCDSTTKNTINSMKNKKTDLVLALGDLSEVKDPDCFFDMFEPVYEKGKLKIVLGYHDTDNDGDDSPSRFSQYLSRFDLARPYYSFDYKNIHFLAMSTGSDAQVPYGKGSEQYNFIKSDLAKASINDKINWIIVCGYRPLYTSSTVHLADPTLKDLYPQLFEKYGVDLVITAHNHNYQRTYPLHSDSRHSNNPEIKDKNRNNYNNPMAPIYLTVGTAGEEIHELFGQAPFVAAQLMQSGFLQVQILKDGTQLNGKFVDDEDNSDKDFFTIHKT